MRQMRFIDSSLWLDAFFTILHYWASYPTFFSVKPCYRVSSSFTNTRSHFFCSVCSWSPPRGPTEKHICCWFKDTKLSTHFKYIHFFSIIALNPYPKCFIPSKPLSEIKHVVFHQVQDLFAIVSSNDTKHSPLNKSHTNLVLTSNEADEGSEVSVCIPLSQFLCTSVSAMEDTGVFIASITICLLCYRGHWK